MMKKNIMILGAGEAQIPIIKESKKLDYNTIVIDFNENAPGFEFADVKLYISTINESEVLNAAIENNIDAILTTSDYPVRAVAYVCNKLGLSGLSLESAEICTNKYLLRECLKNNAILTPKYYKLSTIEDIEGFKNSIEFPMIVKPVDSSASRGVKKVNDLNELQIAFYEAKEFSKCGDVIVEEFVEGLEYSVETLTCKGESYVIAFTEKITCGAEDSFFVEDRHIIPANIQIEEQTKIKALLLKVIKAIGLNNCASHAELKLTKSGPVIIEIGARLGGDYITSDLVPLAMGVNMLENIINISLGDDINIEKGKDIFAGVQFINSENYKSAIKHIEDIKINSNFIRYEMKEFKQNKLTNSSDRLGYIICTSETFGQLSKLLDFN